MNILAVDYGKKRIGLAWMQEGLDVVLPFGVVSNENQENALEEIAATIRGEGIGKIVVGLPLSQDGLENENTATVRDFVKNLETRIDISVELLDERYSSRQADSMGGDVSRDEKAAMVISQSYIDQQSA